jgi:hypothetical protein
MNANGSSIRGSELLTVSQRQLVMARPLRLNDDLTECALADLAGDIDELQTLAGSQLERPRAARREIERTRGAFRPRTLRIELAQLRSAENTFRSYEQALGICLHDISRGAASVDSFRALKNEYTDILRLQHGISAALIAGSDWQSPVFEGAGHPTAGRHSGEVTEHFDDYKRDRHPGARCFEESYLKEYVDAPAGTRARRSSANRSMLQPGTRTYAC